MIKSLLRRIIRRLNTLQLIAWFRRSFNLRGIQPVLGNVCLTMVKNEQDIIEVFVRHNIRFFDAMFVFDHGSADDTRKILNQLSRELKNVIVTDLPYPSYDQSKFISLALRKVQSAVFANAICIIDADEFISAASREEFDLAVNSVPNPGIGFMPWRTFLPDPGIAVAEQPDSMARMTYRRVAENPVYSKLILRLAGELDPGVTVGPGNHKAFDANGRLLPSVELHNLRLMHFPVRSSSQLIAKSVVGWKAYLRNTGKKKNNSGYQWKRIYEKVQAGVDHFSSAEVCNEAMAYAQNAAPEEFAVNAVYEPHNIDLGRRYSDGRFADPDFLIESGSISKPMPSQEYRLPVPPQNLSGASKIEGAFEGDWHWNHPFLDSPPIQYVVERFQPESVLDIGCGVGIYCSLFKYLGVNEVMGIDGVEPQNSVLDSNEYQKVDLHEQFALGKKFDLVLCLEVIEHLRPDATATVLDSIESHAKDLILISIAEPGQPGHGHINCISITEILRLWGARGWQPDLTASLGFRALSTLSWLRRNVIVLRRTNTTGETSSTRSLQAISHMRYKWYSQKPGLRLSMFAEAEPDRDDGYGARKR